MRKKLFVLMAGAFLLTACGGETIDVSCNVEGKKADFTLKNGMVSSYTLDGTKMSQSVIDEINGEYFTSSKDNEEGKTALNTYIQSVNGSCN